MALKSISMHLYSQFIYPSIHGVLFDKLKKNVQRIAINNLEIHLL